jgi:hypothetical protein
MGSIDYRSGFRSSGGFQPGAAGTAVTNHEMNSVAYVPNVGFVACHDSLPVSCISGGANIGRVWGAIGTQRVLGEVPMFVTGGTVWAVDTQVSSYEKIVAVDSVTYPEFVNQKLGVTRLTDAVNCWASSGTEILLLEKGGQITCIPIEPTGDAAPAGTASAPQNVGALALNARVRVWFSPPASSGTSPISDYVVEYSSNNGAKWTQATSFGAGTGDPYSKTVTGLSNGVTYVMRVAARNATGIGAWSKVTIPVTPNPQPPTAPSNLTVTPTNFFASSGSSGGGYNTGFSLSWSAPTGNGGSAITGYRIENMVGSTAYLVGTTTTPATTAVVGAKQPATFIYSLRPGSVYAFRVSAVTSAGVGSPSTTSAGVQLK